MSSNRTETNPKSIECRALGTVPYLEAWALQDELRTRRLRGEIGDSLLLLEHPPVITLGRRDCDGDILTPLDMVRRDGIEVVKTNRGGRATYHGPGQLVGYFICSLDGFNMGIRDFVRAAEEICLGTLERFGVEAGRDAEHPGLWVGRRKIVAIGMNVSHGVTQHGIAMNVSCDLSAYRHIVACGIQDRGVTSIEEVTGCAFPMEAVTRELAQRAGAVLRRTVVMAVE